MFNQGQVGQVGIEGRRETRGEERGKFFWLLLLVFYYWAYRREGSPFNESEG